MKTFYFSAYEQRVPYPPVPYSAWREFLYQYLATLNIGIAVWYFHWRWRYSLNLEALWFSVPLALAETLAFLGSLLFILNLWRHRDPVPQPPPESVNTILHPEDQIPGDRPLLVDIFIPTYSEDPELVRYSIRDAAAIRIPQGVAAEIHVLDDGRRDAMRQVADEEGVRYLIRPDNTGFKAGNLRNGIEQTRGDLLVILDADTRAFPAFLERTLGYFRDPDVAWVQTPQWFYDTVPGEPLPSWLGRRFRMPGRVAGRIMERLVGKVFVGQDLFGNDPRMFYDCILRRRMNYNAAFCCGAGSVHRREAVVRGGLIRYGRKMEAHVGKNLPGETDPAVAEALRVGLQRGFLSDEEVKPYKYHASEDIYTSMLLHADTGHNWKSVHHPEILSKMLSPQDLLGWLGQRYRYASGTLDLFRRDNPLTLKGLSFWQRLMYFGSIYSYFAAFWMLVFLLTPPVFFFTNVVPVRGLDADFFRHILLFQIISQLTFWVGTWGVNTLRDVQYYVAFFPLNLKAIYQVFRGREIRFAVTPKTGERRTYLYLVRPQLLVIGVNLAGIFFYGFRYAMGWPVDSLGFLVAFFWSLINMNSLWVMVRAAMWKGLESTEEDCAASKTPVREGAVDA